MRRTFMRLFLPSLSLCFALAAQAGAQDFQKSYRIGQGDSISIRTVSGDIQVAGYDGETVEVRGFKEGENREMVTVEDASTPNRVDVSVRYPQSCHDCNASLRFEVRVPRSVRYNFEKISTASGNVRVTAVTGEIRAQTASGDVHVQDVTGRVNASSASGNVQVREVGGTVSAQTASGDVNVEIARLEGAEDMNFSSASGNVNVKLPANLDADVAISTLSGSIETNFPLEVKTRVHGPGSSAKGQLGGGARTLRISTASGDVNCKTL